jgi:hypothetical protein
MRRVGRFQTRQTGCPEPDAGRRTEGEALVFASGGDEIYLTYAGRVIPGVEPRTLELTYLAVGGTGRFARAEGEIVVSVVYASPTAFVGRGEGSIRCAAPDPTPR